LSGSTVRLVGYGLTSPTGIATGVRRMGTATVTEMTATELRVAPGPAMSCHGDSGGPVLAPDGAGGEQLIGVTTWGDPGCVEFGVAIRVDPYAAFLQPILDEAASPAPRRAFDPNESLCATSCEHDSDCPEETVCFAPAGAPRRCTYHGLPQAELGAACTGDSASELCVPVGDSCRQLIACESGGEDDGCGCATSRRGGGTTALSFALVIIGLRRRATRRAARST
ncbi:MAG TPA: trypsin-like serine protease, partial [Kofleriaceae bacterium]